MLATHLRHTPTALRATAPLRGLRSASTSSQHHPLSRFDLRVSKAVSPRPNLNRSVSAEAVAVQTQLSQDAPAELVQVALDIDRLAILERRDVLQWLGLWGSRLC